MEIFCNDARQQCWNTILHVAKHSLLAVIVTTDFASNNLLTREGFKYLVSYELVPFNNSDNHFLIQIQNPSFLGFRFLDT